MTSEPSGPETSPPATVRAWDGPTRLFHWMLVLLVAGAWASVEFASELDDPTLGYHRFIGHAILVLVVFRLLWGFVGGSTTRWSAFVVWPWTALDYLRDLLAGRGRRYLGHTPAGAWMILALLGALAVQGVLGLYALEHNYVAAGPLQPTIDEGFSEELTRVHVWFFNVILGLAALHVVANLAYQLIGKDKLITGMVTGRKPAEPYADQAEARGGGWLAAALCLAAAIVIVLGGITALGGRVF